MFLSYRAPMLNGLAATTTSLTEAICDCIQTGAVLGRCQTCWPTRSSACSNVAYIRGGTAGLVLVKEMRPNVERAIANLLGHEPASLASENSRHCASSVTNGRWHTSHAGQASRQARRCLRESVHRWKGRVFAKSVTLQRASAPLSTGEGLRPLLFA